MGPHTHHKAVSPLWQRVLVGRRFTSPRDPASRLSAPCRVGVPPFPETPRENQPTYRVYWSGHVPHRKDFPSRYPEACPESLCLALHRSREARLGIFSLFAAPAVNGHATAQRSPARNGLREGVRVGASNLRRARSRFHLSIFGASPSRCNTPAPKGGRSASPRRARTHVRTACCLHTSRICHAPERRPTDISGLDQDSRAATRLTGQIWRPASRPLTRRRPRRHTLIPCLLRLSGRCSGSSA